MTPEYPYDTPTQDTPLPPDPDPTDASAAGFSLEEFEAARIARHVEALAPPVETPVTRTMAQATAQDFTVVRNEVAMTREVLADIRGILQDILDELRPKRGQRD